MYKFSNNREEINNDTLNKMLSDMVLKLEKYDYMMYPVFKVLYDHGFRVNEVLEAERWKLNEHGIYRVTTEKKSLPRFLEFSQVEKRYRNELNYNEYKGKLLNYSQVRRRFESYFGATFFTNNNRRLITHLFRHNFVKKKFAEGLGVEKIAEIIGEVERKNVVNYIESKIYKEKW